MSPAKNEYFIEGYNVSFPYDAYQCQINYMKKVLFSLKNKKHALLESPTGTGKTMCLLAATLAFQKHFLTNHGSIKKFVESSAPTKSIKSEGGSIEIVRIPQTSNLNIKKEVKTENSPPRVIYSSRTHTQLSQVMRELKASGITEDFKVELFDSEIENKSKIEKSTSKKRSTIKGGKKIFKATILGSRDQLCVHPKISKFRGNLLIRNCRKTTKEGKCRYHNNLKQANITGIAADIQDIEDLKAIASSSENGYFCPFYATREIESICNVVLLPYNYLLDSITRQNLKIDLNNTILILDEAHNIESVAEEAYSFDLRDIDLALSQKAIQNILEATKIDIIKESKSNEEDNELDISFDIEVAVSLVTSIHLLSKNLKEIKCPLPQNKNRNYIKTGEVQGLTFPGSHIYTLFGSSGFGKDNFQVMDECLTNMINFGQNLIGSGSNTSNLLDLTNIQINARIGALERFQRCLRITFNETAMKNPQWFKLYLHYEQDQFKEINSFEGKNDEDYKSDFSQDSEDSLRLYLSFWCFSPAAALSSLVSAGVRSMIITSGTLSPLDSLAQQFSCSNVKFDVFLENEHVIDSNLQLWAASIEKGNSNNTQLIGSYESRNNPLYFSALGSVVLDSVKRIPGGVLLFFASYPLMDQAIKNWTEQGLLDRIKSFKNVFIEPRNSHELGSILDAYMDCIDKNKSQNKENEINKTVKNKGSLVDFVFKTNKISHSGSLLIAVCRGKVSEGINFSDNACRGVIIAGLPFPSIADARISLKKQYMDESNMDGRQWYNQQAIRAVNQAIGRVVRHRNDYGIIILADKRFNQQNIFSKLSRWIRCQIRHLPQLDCKELNSISDFFEKKIDTNSHINKQQIKEAFIKPNNFFTKKNLSVVSFPNLSTEINTILKQVSNKDSDEVSENRNNEKISNFNHQEQKKLSEEFSDSLANLSTWKKTKISSNVSPKNIWRFSTSDSFKKEN